MRPRAGIANLRKSVILRNSRVARRDERSRLGDELLNTRALPPVSGHSMVTARRSRGLASGHSTEDSPFMRWTSDFSLASETVILLSTSSDAKFELRHLMRKSKTVSRFAGLSRGIRIAPANRRRGYSPSAGRHAGFEENSREDDGVSISTRSIGAARAMNLHTRTRAGVTVNRSCRGNLPPDV